MSRSNKSVDKKSAEKCLGAFCGNTKSNKFYSAK